jgi:hypothetical protein
LNGSTIIYTKGEKGKDGKNGKRTSNKRKGKIKIHNVNEMSEMSEMYKRKLNEGNIILKVKGITNIIRKYI